MLRKIQDTEMSFPLSYPRQNGQDLIINKIRPEEHEEIVEFFFAHFMPRLPIRQICQYDDGPKKFKRPNWMWDEVRQCISKPISLSVRDPATNGQLAAVLLNVIEVRPSESAQQVAEEEQDLLTVYLDELNKDINFFDIFEIDEIMHNIMVAVSPDYTQLGLASKMYQLSLDIAIANGVKAVKTEAANIYTAKVATKLRYTPYKVLDLASLEYLGTRPLANYPEITSHNPKAHLLARRVA